MDWSGHNLFPWLQSIRRDIHTHPELAMEEKRTTKLVRAELEKLGIPLQDLPGLKSGLAALLEGNGPGPTLAIRADMDALAMEEMNDKPYRSQNPGAMHACGHDAHTAILLGVAKAVTESGLMKKLPGRVKLIFQPAEENLTGAKAMIEAGVLENPAPDMILGFHMDPDAEVGKANLYRGVSHAASDRFLITVQGRGGHAGAPHKSADPVIAACHMVLAIQSIVSRNIDPLDSGVVTIGIIQAGSAPNIIPDQALIRGSIRSFTKEDRELIFRRIGEIAEGVGKGLGVEGKAEIFPGVIPCVNHPEASELLFRAAAKTLGEKNVQFNKPRTGSEDFALFADKVPGAVVRLGCRNEAQGIKYPAHSPWYDLDEEVMPLGVELMLAAIEDRLTSRT